MTNTLTALQIAALTADEAYNAERAARIAWDKAANTYADAYEAYNAALAAAFAALDV